MTLTASDPETKVPAGHTRVYAFYMGQMGAEGFIGCVDVITDKWEEDEEQVREDIQALFKEDGGFWGIGVRSRGEVIGEFNTYAEALGQPEMEQEEDI